MNFIDEILQNLNIMSSDEIIQIVGGNIYDETIDKDRIFDYPQFIQDIVFLVDMDTQLNMEGDVLGYSTEKYIPNMVIALKNIHADNDAFILQNIYEIHKSSEGVETENKLKEIDEEIDNLYKKMYLYTDTDIWGLLDVYVENEKGKYLEEY